MSKILAGAFPVLPTPFRDDGSIDEADFLSIIDFALESNVDGVVYPGVASEVDTLSPQERKRQVELLAQRIGGASRSSSAPATRIRRRRRNMWRRRLRSGQGRPW